MSPRARVALLVAGLLTVTSGGVAAAGLQEPPRHAVIASVWVEAPREVAWTVVTAFEEVATWRPGIAAVHLGRTPEGLPMVVEESAAGVRETWLVAQARYPDLLELRVTVGPAAEAKVWTYTFFPEEDGSRVTLIEEVSEPNPLLRGVRRLAGSRERRLEDYLEAGAARARAQSDAASRVQSP